MANLLLAVIYIAFISLGLPDAVLGAAWPTMSGDLHAPISWAGGISMTISAGTIVSALLSDRMTLRFGAGKVTAVSVALTAFALFGFSISPNYWMLLLFAIPYGLGAGGVDAALNNYVAIHYESRHMSWLHAMWGLGTLLGPYIMASALGAGHGWAWGYRTISILWRDSHERYGARKIEGRAGAEGRSPPPGRRIVNIMKRRGMTSAYARRTFKPHKTRVNEARLANILDREFDGYEPRTHLASDLTYVRVGGKWAYVCLLIDLANRSIAGHSADTSRTADLVMAAFATLDFPLTEVEVFHTDRGSEFDNAKIDELLDVFDIRRSLVKEGATRTTTPWPGRAHRGAGAEPAVVEGA